MSWLSELFSHKTETPAAPAANEQIRLMEEQQAKHDAAVAAGKASIDTAFSQFDPAYFDKYGQSYRDVYNPELDSQYALAKDKIYATLAGRDQLGGSVGNAAQAQLGKTYANTQTDIGNKSIDAENAFKASVDNTKTNLYKQNADAADPLSMAAQAQSTAGTIVSPQSYPTLGSVFGDALSAYGTGAKASNQSMNPNPVFSPNQWFAPTSGAGSSVGL